MCVCVCVCVYSSTPHPLGANSSNGSRKSLRKCCGRKKEKNRKEKKKQEKIETREREREGNSFGGLRRLENFVLGPLERQRPQINFCFFAAAAAAGGEIKKKTPKKRRERKKMAALSPSPASSLAFFLRFGKFVGWSPDIA